MSSPLLRRVARVRLGRVLIWLALAAPVLAANAQELSLRPASSTDSAAVEQPAADIDLNNRRIARLRAWLGGESPADRARVAQEALESALQQHGKGFVTRVAQGETVRFEVDGQTVLTLVPEDVGGTHPAAALDAASFDVLRRLQTAINEDREMSDLRALGRAAAFTAGATLVMFLWLRGVWWLRQRATLKVQDALREQDGPVSTYLDYARALLRLMATALTWGAVLLSVDVWVSFVLRQFAYTRPWGERSTAWLLELLQRLVLNMAGAVPGLLVAVLIFVIARLVAKANAAFLGRVERGQTRLSWLDRDTAVPTRRLSSVVIWLFALAMAYPYLPGANSEAFRGVSVLAGLMLSLGASGLVGQAMSGMSLMYARALRVGEYVKIGDTEGTVTHMGIFATKVHTGLGEEVSLPNAVVFSQPVRNFSRLVENGQYLLHAAVTIGYATPWRQVHAMLLEAAARTPGVARLPAPYVVQTALSDFYVEYRLCAQGSLAAPAKRAEAMSQLHAHIQDVFNDNGVQIMSPHYLADPPAPQVVPPGTTWGGRGGQPLQAPEAPA